MALCNTDNKGSAANRDKGAALQSAAHAWHRHGAPALEPVQLGRRRVAERCLRQMEVREEPAIDLAAAAHVLDLVRMDMQPGCHAIGAAQRLEGLVDGRDPLR